MGKILKIVICFMAAIGFLFTALPDARANAPVPMRLDVPNFRQDWEPWKYQKLGFSSGDIEMTGCALTSLAMVLKYYGADTDPEELNQWLKDNGGFVAKNAIVWSKAAEKVDGLQYLGTVDFRDGADLDRIKSEIDNGYPVIARMNYKGSGHYAVICGYEGNTFFMNDPWYEDPSHTIDRVVRQGDIDVKYDNNEDPVAAIKNIVIFRTDKSTPPKVPVVKVRSIFKDFPEVMLHQLKTPTIELKVGDPYMYVNGVKKKIDPEKGASPKIVGGRTLLPIRAVIEEMGGKIEWNDQDKKVTIRVQDRTMEIWIGKRTAYNNMWYVEFDVVPQIIDGRTMLPLRIISEQLGCDVQWEESTKKITLREKRE